MSETWGTVPELSGLIGLLAHLPQDVPDPVRIDRIRALEELKSAAAAAQARETAGYAESQKQAQRAAGVPASQVGRGIPGAIGLARRISPHQAARYTGWAAILTRELPAAFAALQAGQVSEWRAMLVAKESIWLSRDRRGVLDAELAPKLAGLGDRRVEAEARRIGYRLDPHGYLDRFAAAVRDRHVSLRPAPEAMTRLTALLPVAQGVAAYAALTRAADSTTAAGDDRGRGQIMADTLVERLTGHSATDVPVTVNLLITDRALLGGPADTPDVPPTNEDGPEEPAHVDGYGPVPAWLIDHVLDAARAGPTTTVNGQGYCEMCNHTKQAPGWRTTLIDDSDGVHEVETRTPTGHTYRGQSPDPPRVAHAGRHPDAPNVLARRDTG